MKITFACVYTVPFFFIPVTMFILGFGCNFFAVYPSCFVYIRYNFAFFGNWLWFGSRRRSVGIHCPVRILHLLKPRCCICIFTFIRVILFTPRMIRLTGVDFIIGEQLSWIHYGPFIITNECGGSAIL